MMEQKSILYKTEVFAPPGYKTASGSELRYGLMLLIDLAHAYGLGGLTLSFFSKKYKLPLSELELIVRKLEKRDLIKQQTDEQRKYFLNYEPDSYWITKVIPVLKELFLN